jgi:hypothetical protein
MANSTISIATIKVLQYNTRDVRNKYIFFKVDTWFFASVRPLPGVNSFVSLKSGRLREHAAATRKRTRMLRRLRPGEGVAYTDKEKTTKKEKIHSGWKTTLPTSVFLLPTSKNNALCASWYYTDGFCGCLIPGNTKGGSITVPLTSCLTALESAVSILTIFGFICKTD